MLHWARDCAKKAGPESFGRLTAIEKNPALLDDPVHLRTALLDFIADFADWDNSTDDDYLETSRSLVQAAHEALGGESDTRPLVVDPFAGGGSIPLEALRVGADAFASDLNPIPVLLNRIALEDIPKYGDRLGREVRKWGEWIEREAQKEVGRFYPPDVDGSSPIAYLWARTVLSEAPGPEEHPVEVPLISSMWLSKKPHRGRALRWVRDSEGRVRYQTVERIYRDGRTLVVREPLLEVFEPASSAEVQSGTAKRGAATCPVTGFTTPVGSVRAQLQSRRGGTLDARLICVVTIRADRKGRFYRTPVSSDLAAARAAEVVLANKSLIQEPGELPLVPHEEISRNEIRRISIPLYGMASWGDAFSARQLLTLTTVARLVREAGEACTRANGGDVAFGSAVQALLALNVGKAADYGSALATWSSPASQETVRNTFARQAIAMVWDYAEANPLAASSGGWSHSLRFVDRLISAVAHSQLHSAHVEQASATRHPLPDHSAQALVTDPPYYDAVPYAYLSDFFYVWLRRSLPQGYRNTFATDTVPKDEEIVVDRPHKLSSSKKDVAFYEHELSRAFAEARRIVAPSGIGTIVFASKSTASWEAILQAVVDAGWTITGSWPLDTEREGRLASIGQARLASSVHLVVRPRENPDSTRTGDVGDWRDVLSELPLRIHEWMPRLAEEGVVGADAIFACLGPGLEIFSRYSRVEKASGQAVSLREYLEQVWAAVSNEALSVIFKDADAAGLEPDARLTAMWLWTVGAGKSGSNGAATTKSEGADQEDADDEDEPDGKRPKLAGFTLEFDAARKIAQGLGVHLEKLESLVEIKGETARLVPVSERTRYLFGKDAHAEQQNAPRGRKKAKQGSLFEELAAAELTRSGMNVAGVAEASPGARPGMTVLDRIHQAMILFAAGRGEAMKRFLVDDGAGTDPRFWRLAQSLSALYPAGTDEKRWVDGVLARKKGLGFQA
jgi:adenine-specific DNA methylase